MLTILLIILLLALVGAFPAWPYSAGWGLPKRQFGPASLDPYRRSTGSQAPGTLGSGESVSHADRVLRPPSRGRRISPSSIRELARSFEQVVCNDTDPQRRGRRFLEKDFTLVRMIRSS
jgi:hypothetical protein